MKDPGDLSSPSVKVSGVAVGMVVGLMVLCLSLTCITLGLLYLDSCPRHPLLSVWLLVMGVVLSLISLSLISLPAFNNKNRINTSKVKMTKCTIVLVFLTTLLSVLLVLTIISWLSVGTFWLLHTGPRLPGEYELACSTVLLVMVGITVVVSWLGLLAGLAWATYTSCRVCDWSRASYFPVRRTHREGYTKLSKAPSQPSKA